MRGRRESGQRWTMTFSVGNLVLQAISQGNPNTQILMAHPTFKLSILTSGTAYT
jgi:hypothetical protein